MVFLILRRYRNMVLVGIIFFYIGCMVTLTLSRLECTEALVSIRKSDYQDSLSKYEYAVLIISRPNNEARRDAIRATWGKFTRNIFTEHGEMLYKWNHTWIGQETQEDLIKLVFVIGTQGLSEMKLLRLKTENNRSNDLLLLDSLEDRYKNLASKMLHSLRWFSVNMRGLKYLIKCDDDSFVRVDLIVKDLEAYAPNMNDPAINRFVSSKNILSPYKGLYWGYFNGQAQVYLSGKWEEKDWFLCDNYLPYALGGGYVLSRSIIDFIARNADFLSNYNSEDVSVGVWTASLDGINRVHDIRFDTQWKSRGCSHHMLIRHKQTPNEMFQLYKTLVYSQGQKLCKTEESKLQSYMYKWDVLPSKCCKP